MKPDAQTTADLQRAIRLAVFDALIRAGLIAPESNYEEFIKAHGPVMDEMQEKIVRVL